MKQFALKNLKLIIISALLIIAGCGVTGTFSVTGGIFSKDSSAKAFGEFLKYTPQCGTFEIKIKSNGKIECIKEYNITVPDRIWDSRIEKLAAEGAEIKSGEVICKLNTRNFEESVTRAEGQVANSENELEELKKNNDLEEYSKNNEIEKKNLQYEVNLFKLNETKKGADTIDVEISSINIDKNSSNIDNFKNKLKSQEELKKRGFLSSFQYADMELEYQNNQLELEKNKNKLESLQNEPDINEIKKYEMNVAKYSLDLELARKEIEAFKNVNKIEEDKKLLDIKHKNKRLEMEKKVIVNAEMKAPIDGTLLYQNTWMGKTRIGMNVWQGLGILKIVDFSAMKITVSVNEKYIDRFKEGADARIIVSALPGKLFNGYVKSVSNLAKLRDETDPKGPKDFDVTIYFKDTFEVKLLPNMSADVDIICKKIENAVKIPKDMVNSENKISFIRPYKKELVVFKQTISEPAASEKNLIAKTDNNNAGATAENRVGTPQKNENQVREIAGVRDTDKLNDGAGLTPAAEDKDYYYFNAASNDILKNSVIEMPFENFETESVNGTEQK